MVLKEYGYYYDISSTEMASLMSDARRHIQEVRDLLAQHDIQVADAMQQNVHDYRSYGNVIKTAVGFASREDLVMARLLVEAT